MPLVGASAAIGRHCLHRPRPCALACEVRVNGHNRRNTMCFVVRAQRHAGNTGAQLEECRQKNTEAAPVHEGAPGWPACVRNRKGTGRPIEVSADLAATRHWAGDNLRSRRFLCARPPCPRGDASFARRAWRRLLRAGMQPGRRRPGQWRRRWLSRGKPPRGQRLRGRGR